MPLLHRQTPTAIRPNETERLNTCWFPLKPGFEPVRNVTYLWVLTENQIILGIERPWAYPQAFFDTDDSAQSLIMQPLLNQIRGAGQLGHPTLSAHFNDDGSVDPSQGEALLGGELTRKNDVCHINNNSGRFNTLKNWPKEDAKAFMYDLKFEFQNLLAPELEVHTFLLHTPSKSSNLYQLLWQDGNSKIESLLNILRDYTTIPKNTNPTIYARSVGKLHINLLDRFVNQIEASIDAPLDPKHCFEVLKDQLKDSKMLSQDKSLKRRLMFIEQQLTDHVADFDDKENQQPTLTQPTL